MTVYFIQAGKGSPVKIGQSGDPVRRCAALQSAHFDSLEIIRQVDGDHETEHWLHSHFKDSRLQGEWFKFQPSMMDVNPPNESQPILIVGMAAHFLKRVDAFINASNIDPTALGKSALNDPGFVFNVRAGRSPSSRTMDRIIAWIDDNPP